MVLVTVARSGLTFQSLIASTCIFFVYLLPKQELLQGNPQ